MTPGSARKAVGQVWQGFGRFRPLVVFYLVGVVLFAVFRVIFLLHNRGFIRQVPLVKWLQCLGIGWFYDTAVVCALLLPAAAILPVVSAGWFESRRLRAVFSTAAAALLAGCVLACASDLFFFDHYADRLNYQAFSYPLYRLDVLDMIADAYPVGWAAAMTVLIGLLSYTFFEWLAWPRPAPGGPGRLTTAARLAAAPAAAGLVVLGLLGPPGRLDRDDSPTHLTGRYLVRRASLNCVGTLAQAAVDVTLESYIRPERYGLGDAGEALRTARDLLLQPNDQPVEQPGNPLVRVSRSARPRVQEPPNVVLIVMESMAADYFQSLGGSSPWTPEIEALGRSGVVFDRFYAVGTRTSRGLLGVLGGFPDLPGLPTVQSRRTRGPFLSLAEILRDRGYATLFIHGGNLKFNDVKRYIRRHGFETVIDRTDFDEYVEQKKRHPLGPPGEAAFTTYWSVDDQSVFLRANAMLRRQSQPFFAVILTLTNHPTYDVPADVFSWTVRMRHPDLPAEMSEEERAVRYADWAVGDFFRRAAREDYFRRTLFVLVADHCRDQRKDFPVDGPNFQIFAAMVGPESLLGQPRRISTVASQTDLPPTVLARLGGDFTHCFFGRDIFRVDDGGFALFQQNGSIGFLRDDRLVCIVPDVPQPTIRCFTLRGRDQVEWSGAEPDEARRFADTHRQGAALFQAAVELFQSGNYSVADR